MFGSSENRNGFGTFSGPNGSGSVFSSGNTAWVSGTNGHDGMYTRVGNTVFGPEGMSTVMGSGNIHTVHGPDGSTSTFFGNVPF